MSKVYIKEEAFEQILCTFEMGGVHIAKIGRKQGLFWRAFTSL